MPMVWNSAADAKLFACVMQIYDVKVSGEKLNQIAELMGPDCTPKAITHRLSKYRKEATDTTSGSPSTPAKSKKAGSGAATPRAKPAGKSTGKSASKGKGIGKAAAKMGDEGGDLEDEEDDEEQEQEQDDTPSKPAKSVKRGRGEDDDDDEDAGVDTKAKKVKEEVVDEA